MRIEINGQSRDVPGDIKILGLLEYLGFKPMGVVVERNGQIVDREAFESTALCENDRLELVRLVGGG